MKTRMRKLTDLLMRALCAFATLLLVGVVLIILYYVVKEGSASLNMAFLTHLPRPVGIPGGGMGNAIVGSIEIVAFASGAGIPIGVCAGIYLAEYGRGRFASAVRFLAEVLNGIPTIVFGIVAYAVVVVPMHTFSAWAGATALAIIMIPLVTRSAELAVRQIPSSWREASVALGASSARTLISVVVPAARAGILTGATLAVARVAGETAPLLFTAFGNDVDWPRNPAHPTAALPLQVFVYAMSPYEDWKSQAWAGALTLIALVLALSIVVRLVSRSGSSLAARL